MSHTASSQLESTTARPLNLLQVWFSYAGRISAIDYWVKGFAPGILLGIAAVRIDAEADLQGALLIPFLILSQWPSSALLTKRWRDWRSSRKGGA